MLIISFQLICGLYTFTPIIVKIPCPPPTRYCCYDECVYRRVAAAEVITITSTNI